MIPLIRRLWHLQFPFTSGTATVGQIFRFLLDSPAYLSLGESSALLLTHLDSQLAWMMFILFQIWAPLRQHR
jgi:hypothetical protein